MCRANARHGLAREFQSYKLFVLATIESGSYLIASYNVAR